jgi:hypothetical protein
MPTWEINSPQKLSFDDVRQLRLRTVRGNVHVVGTDGQARLEVTGVRGRGLKVREDGGTIDIGYDDWRVPRGFLSWLVGLRGWRRRAVISAAVPRHCLADLGVISASVVVSGLRERVDVRVTSGDIALADLAGPVDADAVAGSIEAHAVAGNLRMHTVSGDLSVVDGSGGTVYADTTSGSVTCDLAGAGAGDIRLSTVSGEIVIRLPEDSDLRYRLRATSGTLVTCDAFGPAGGHRSPGLSVLDGKVGAGTGELSANTVSGHISLLRRPAAGRVRS